MNGLLASALFSALVLVAYAEYHHGHDSHHEVDYYAPPHYDFEYKVQDGHTGDVKSQHEQRVGDEVKGSYSHHQPDGTILQVHYTADKHNGYNAHVTKIGKAVHPEPHYHHHAPHHY